MTVPQLYGREEPLAALRAAFADAREGRGRLVVISGDAGIGKSVLVAALAAEAEGERSRVIWGRAWEYADAPPYFPLWPCLLDLGIELQQVVGGEAELGRSFRLWERVLSSLARESAELPFLWIVEDAHAADLGTLDLLTFLVQPLRALRVLVVATVRSQDQRLGDRQLQRLRRMAHDGVEIRLDALPKREVADLMRAIVGRPLPERALQKVVELTSGNPLFVVECARALRGERSFEHALDSLPMTLRQIVLERVAIFPEPTRTVLDAGAILGRELSADSVARILGWLPARVIDALDPALRAGVLREARPGHFVFSHAVVCDAIEAALDADRRSRFHAAAEAVLASRGDTADVIVERARHALGAGAYGDPGHALAIAARAARLLEREGAFDRAFELHMRVLEHREAGWLAPATPEELLHVVRVARDAGRAEVATRLCEQVVRYARDTADGNALAKAALAHASVIRPAVIDPHQIALLEEAHRGLGTGTPKLSCRVLARWATALQPADDPLVPNEMAREARRQAHETGDAEVILDALELGGLGMYGSPLADRLEWTRDLHDRAVAAGDMPKALNALSWLSYWHVEAGDFAAFDEVVTLALELSDQLGDPRWRWGALLLASGRALAAGRFAESDRHVVEVSQIAALIDDPSLALALVAHEAMRATLRRHRGALESAFAQLDAVLTGVKRSALYAMAMRASCVARFGDVDAVNAQRALLGEQAKELEGEVDTLAYLAEAYALVGNEDDRRRARALLAATSSRGLFGGGVSYTYEGRVERVLGLLDASLDDLDAAEANLRVAYEDARSHRQLPWIAQCGSELAVVLARKGNAGEAASLTKEARSIATELGIERLAGERLDDARGDASDTLRMTRTGDVWTVQWGPATARVKDSRGMQLLHRLTERSGEDVHVLALASDEGESLPETHAGELLDEPARRAYRSRIAQIDAALTGERRPATIGRLHAERDALVRELARAVGLGGKARRAGSATERARINVQRRLKEAVGRIAELDARLGEFFEQSLSTGTYCRFEPARRS